MIQQHFGNLLILRESVDLTFPQTSVVQTEPTREDEQRSNELNMDESVASANYGTKHKFIKSRSWPIDRMADKTGWYWPVTDIVSARVSSISADIEEHGAESDVLHTFEGSLLKTFHPPLMSASATENCAAVALCLIL